MRKSNNFPPAVAVAYKGEFNKNGKKGKYVRVYIKEDLKAGDTIIGFLRDKPKTKETDPDFSFRLSDPAEQKPKSTKGRTSLRQQESNLDDEGLEDDANDF